ncbi:MAG: AgmX/PglI C-terminal domain-containing protein [Kofleriaceae bacterium]|nr:AgmX/PglI C-terminal domain-containing protein [Kofleriaceae bacterium]
MRGAVGIIIGLALGAGGMYLALRPPWGGGGTPPPPDAGVIATAPPDAVVTKGKKKRRKRPAGTVAPSTNDPSGEWEEYEETTAAILSDADRKLEWRGDDTTLPRSTIDMAGGGEARPLDDAEINNTVASQSKGVQDCVVQGATGTDLQATITIKLVVDGNGRVTKSRIQAPHYLFEKGLLGCVQRALGKMKFPATGAPTSVTFPVNLG